VSRIRKKIPGGKELTAVRKGRCGRKSITTGRDYSFLVRQCKTVMKKTSKQLWSMMSECDVNVSAWTVRRRLLTAGCTHVDLSRSRNSRSRWKINDTLGKGISDMDYKRMGKSKQSLYNSFLTSEIGFLSVSVRLDFQPSVSWFTSMCMCTVLVVFIDEGIIHCKTSECNTSVACLEKVSDRTVSSRVWIIPRRSWCGVSWACSALAVCALLKGI